MEIIKTLLRGVGKGMLAAVTILMFASLSFAGTTIYVHQAATTGALTVKTITDNGTITNPVVQSGIPNSCFTPDLFWDSDAGKLRINGFDSSNDPAWTGSIDVNGQLQNIMPNSATVTCGSATSSVVSAVFPDQPTVFSSPACSSWTYGSWTPASCAAGSIQTRTATGSPSGCIGFPDAATVQSCPPQTCTSFTYACNGTCTPNASNPSTGTCPAVVTNSSPAGCSGGTPATTTSCTPGVACTGYTYSDWGACTNGSQTRTVTGYTPASCTGTPSASPVLTQSGCSTNGDPSGVINMAVINKEYNTATMAANTWQYFKFTLPAAGCTSAYKTLMVNMITLNTSLQAGQGQVLIKSSNQGTSTWPTVADLQYEYAAHAYGLGQDWTRDTKGGVFFWNFARITPSTITPVMSAYSGHTFKQGDTYYVLLYNQGPGSNSYRLIYSCY